MNSTPTIRALVLSASVLALTAGSTLAQQITGTPRLPHGAGGHRVEAGGRALS